VYCFNALCNISFKEHLPEDGHNSWPKHVIYNAINLHICICTGCRSHRQRGLRRKSAAARLLRLWVRFPPAAWMSVCCLCCTRMLSGRGLCDKLINRPEESHRLCCVVVCDLETLWMRRAWPTGGCRAKNKNTHWLVLFLIMNHQCTVMNHLKSKLVYFFIENVWTNVGSKVLFRISRTWSNFARGSKVRSVRSPTQIPPSPARGEPALTNYCGPSHSGLTAVTHRENAAEHACPEAKWWQPHHWTA